MAATLLKKGKSFSRPQPGCQKSNSPWPRIKLFPARESSVSDIPAGDEKIANLFLQCIGRKGDFLAVKVSFQSSQDLL